MEFFYTVVALITAGVALATGLVNLFIGLHKDGEKVDLFFGLMSFSMFIFFLLPPIGFILVDSAPYSMQVDVKRLFNNAFVALFPWFVILYTGYKKKMIALVTNALVVVYYVIMISTRSDSQKPLWVYFLLLALAVNLVFGFYAGFFQISHGDKKKGRWFIGAMACYAFLYVLTVVNQLGNNYFGTMMGTKLFFPINLFPLSFMLIMSIRLRTNIFEKYRLEKVLGWRDVRWNAIVRNMQLIIVELDNEGKINFLNPYAITALNCHSLTELLDKNWFDHFSPKEQIDEYRSLYLDNIRHEKQLNKMGKVLTKNGLELTVNWTSVFLYNDKGEVTGTMSIGLNITDKENAFKEIQFLKTELEKENLIFDAQLMAKEEVNVVGQSETILYVIQKARQVATTNAAVLLEGETGVGKELFADIIHKHSYRNKEAFIKINCAALPPELIESELFGHEKGAFTGAIQARKGRFELSNNGTIFLDEIGELPLHLQPKLLRVLQSGEFERIGGQETIKVDVRIISATNRDLLNEVRNGLFREDLYYRLNVFPITIPPLRSRREDIKLLVNYFVRHFSQNHQKQIENISKADMVRLVEYQWPGNIRELINVVERSVILSQGNTLKVDWNMRPVEGNGFSSEMEAVQRAHILKVLEECNWKINGVDGAGVKLGLNPNTLRSRMKKLNISRG